MRVSPERGRELIAGIVRTTTARRRTGMSPRGVTIVCCVGFGACWAAASAKADENGDPVRNPNTTTAAAMRWYIEGPSGFARQQFLSQTERMGSGLLGWWWVVSGWWF